MYMEEKEDRTYRRKSCTDANAEAKEETSGNGLRTTNAAEAVHERGSNTRLEETSLDQQRRTHQSENEAELDRHPPHPSPNRRLSHTAAKKRKLPET